jgi:EAL domain-containing protein (putative c-di-GMP-specific phosphodiesterase class I)
MVDAVIKLAHSLGMTSLAEGIETEKQWHFLRDQGCSFGQGYYFSRPVPPDEIATIARSGQLRMADDVTP